ncbi:carbon-nitrogen hydrolase family protein [Ensifer sp. T173]|uniref:Carbon-nitrogen hydrolase family protein n=1 Tax=Ensifer canadensis TaxID=555315 RepID=A0AAW4FXE4_9HYPH|nr:carbon-nitrogen hydrolase family protein [Ensifer canadensis]MBM3096072.1 carbon-nitrogen hydrolase family protein [Ensifer canadensis]UBI73973.1 carbon-nitrogen hydrolase family protein [Ensifer canadensis]
MKIAAAQTAVTKDLSENAAVIKQLLCDAASKGVRLVSFCEGALSGYSKAQIADPDAWLSFDWRTHEEELRRIGELCGKLGIYAVVGGAHMLSTTSRPHNSLYVLSAAGELLTRYDKRFLSNSEVNDWYTPGTDPIIFEADGYRFGCAICIESQFPEVFSEYERLAADVVLFSSYGIPEHFQVALRAHAGLNCLWISASTPAQKAAKGPAGIIGPDGKWSATCAASATSCYTVAVLDRDDPAYDVPLQKARPWRKRARSGDIYRERIVNDPRSMNRKEY